MASCSSGPSGSTEPRMPQNMKGLLRICNEIAEPSNESKSSTEVISQMDAEKREFLEHALKEISTSPVDRMRACIHLIKTADDTEDGVEAQLQALDELIQWVGQIDFAIDFHKIGGYETFPLLLNHEETELRWTCLELIAEIVQNNPYCQKALLESGVLPILLYCLDKDSNPTVKTKALYAVSCLVRDDPLGQKLFTEYDGYSVLMRAMQTDIEKLKIKSSFMLRSMCSNDPTVKATLCDIGMVEQLVGLLTQEHTQYHEHVMNALLVLLKDNSRAQQTARQPELNLTSILLQRIDTLRGQDEHQEEVDYATQILKLLKGEEKNQSAIR